MGYGSFGKYRIDVIDKNQNVKYVINDFVSLTITDILNGIGTWSISNVSEDHPDFQIGDIIRVFRDDVMVFGGVYTQLSEEYLPKYQKWSWKVSGAGLNQFLKWKLVYPELDEDDEQQLADPYLVYYDTDCKNIINRIIEKNAVYHADGMRVPPGFTQVSGARSVVNGFEGPATDVRYRFENLYDAVMELAEFGSINVLPLVTDEGKVLFGLTKIPDSDVSDKVIFNADLDHILKFTHSVKFPAMTNVINGYNEDHRQARWCYGNGEVLNAYKWTMAGQHYETFQKPRKEDVAVDQWGTSYVDYKDSTDPDPNIPIYRDIVLDFNKLAKADAEGREVSTEAYDVTINSIVSPFTYGFAWRQNYSFTTDYWLGATIGVIVEGRKYTGMITKMEINVSYGSENMKASIGGLARGSFDGVLSNLYNLNKSVNRAENTEGK